VIYVVLHRLLSRQGGCVEMCVCVWGGGQFLFRQALFRHFKSSSPSPRGTPSPVCFNVHADRAVIAQLNTRRSRLPGGGCTCLERSAFVGDSKDDSPGC